MIHLLCQRGHASARHAWEHYREDSRCMALDGSGFCLAPAWQDPSTVRKGDQVGVFARARLVVCIVRHWSLDPDRHAHLIDVEGTPRSLYLGGWFTPNEPHRGQAPPLTLEAAAEALPGLKAQLRAYQRERRDIARERRADIPMKEPCVDGPDVHGGPEIWDTPWRLHDETEDANVSKGLEIHLDDYPRFVASMAFMRWRYPQHYRRLTQNIHQGLQPRDIRDLEGISHSAARQQLHRARVKLRQVMASPPTPNNPKEKASTT